MRATDIASGAPAWVWALLVALIILGVRRLRTRDTPVVAALIPPAAFLVWSVVGAHAFAAGAGIGAASGAWAAGAVSGALTGIVLSDRRGERLPGGRVRQPGSRLPLILHLGVFAVRFACGAWAAILPAQAAAATAVGMAAGATMTARLVVGVIRWRPARSR